MRSAGAPVALGSLIAAAVLTTSCVASSCPPELPDDGGAAITVTSERFVTLGSIRSRYTCDGIDLSPDVPGQASPRGPGASCSSSTIRTRNVHPLARVRHARVGERAS